MLYFLLHGACRRATMRPFSFVLFILVLKLWGQSENLFANYAVSVILNAVDYTLMKESKEVLLSQRRKVDLQAKHFIIL